MKLRIILTVAILLASAGLGFAGTNDLTSFLQKGLFEEEANHNLDAALRDYQAAVDEFDKDRQLDATAVFRLGECFRKLGRTNEASVQYERVLREFPDQTNLVKLSSDYLGGAKPAALPAEGPDTKAAQLQSAYDDLKLKLTLVQRELASLTNLTKQVAENYFTTVKPDSVLVGLLGERAEAEKKLSEVRGAGYGPNNPTYKTAENLLNDINERMVQRIEALVWGLQQEAQVLQAQADGVHALLMDQVLQEATRTVGGYYTTTANSGGRGRGGRPGLRAALEPQYASAAPVPATSAEDEEIRKIKEMIQNSPDLINVPDSLPGKTGVPLLAVVRDGNITAAELLLANGANVNDNAPETPLSMAAARGFKAMMELLLAKGADVNAKDNDGAKDTPLHHAAAKGFKTTVEFLLAHKADVNARNKYGLTPLYLAAENGFRAVAELLLASGADVNARAQVGDTPTFVPIQDEPGPLNRVESGDTPIVAAIQTTRPETVQLLLTNNADINATNLSGETPLFAAIQHDGGEFVPLLLAFHANVNVRNKSGQTPLHLAVHVNQAGTLKLLLAHKADANAVTDAGVSPLLLAVAMRNIDASLVKSLLDSGADTKAHVPEGGVAHDTAASTTIYIDPGSRPVDLAIENDRADLLEMVLAHGADPNSIRPFSNDNDPRNHPTLLLSAIARNAPDSAELVKILLDHKANPDLADGNGTTPLCEALALNNLKTVQELIDHHADVNKTDGRGNPPLSFLHSPFGSGFGGQPGDSDGATASQIKAFLLKAGANEDYERLARIFIAQKGTGSVGREVFYKGTNSFNHYTLFEILGETYRVNVNLGIPFPDLAHLVINRLKTNGTKEEIAINLDEILKSGDCSKDVPLEWGDVVQIPGADHPGPNSGEIFWQGFRRDDIVPATLKKCLQRQVKIIVKAQTNTLTLAPRIAQFDSSEGSTPAQGIFYTFSLNEVVHKSNLLMLSSDLSRVKVNRNGVDMYFDLESQSQFGGRGGGSGRRLGGGGGDGGFGGNGGFGVSFSVESQRSSDLWLENGDVIEIPERDPNAPDPK